MGIKLEKVFLLAFIFFASQLFTILANEGSLDQKKPLSGVSMNKGPDQEAKFDRHFRGHANESLDNQKTFSRPVNEAPEEEPKFGLDLSHARRLRDLFRFLKGGGGRGSFGGGRGFGGGSGGGTKMASTGFGGGSSGGSGTKTAATGSSSGGGEGTKTVATGGGSGRGGEGTKTAATGGGSGGGGGGTKKAATVSGSASKGGKTKKEVTGGGKKKGKKKEDTEISSGQVVAMTAAAGGMGAMAATAGGSGGERSGAMKEHVPGLFLTCTSLLGVTSIYLLLMP